MKRIRCDELDARLIELAGDGGTIKSIARAAGVGLGTLYQWLANDEEFQMRFYMPLETARAQARRKIITAALLGDLKAAKIVLGWPELGDPEEPDKRGGFPEFKGVYYEEEMAEAREYQELRREYEELGAAELRRLIELERRLPEALRDGEEGVDYEIIGDGGLG